MIDAIREGQVEPVFNQLFAKIKKAVPHIGLLYQMAKAKNGIETTLSRAIGADYVLIGRNAFVPNTKAIDIGYGKYLITCQKDRSNKSIQVSWAASF